MFPKFLTPTSTELFIIGKNEIEIPKCIVTFNKWIGSPVAETFGGKAIISVDNKPMFAELGIMAHFLKDGWQARWIETYGKSKNAPIFISEWKDEKYKNQIHSPIIDKNILSLLSDIEKLNGESYSGCWDVLAWKNDMCIFAESKRTKKDSIRVTQINWLKAALKHGLLPINFLVVQWDMI